MDYPRQIKLSAERKEALISYLNEEILAHQSERSKWVSDLLGWQQDYWAPASTEKVNFPFQGAASLTIPLTAIAVEAVHAREMTTLFSLDQFTAVKIYDPASQDIQYDIRNAIDWELLGGSNIYKFADEALLENKKLGTAIGKVGYEKIVKTAIKTVGDTETEFDVVVKQGPVVNCVPLANFLMPFTARDPQESPWCGEEHLETLYRVKQLSESGFFLPEVMDELSRFYQTGQNLSSTPYTQAVRQFQDQTPIQWPREISWHEIELSFDVDGSKKEKEIVVHYHRLSQTFFSIRYNDYDDLHRSYRVVNYFPLEHRWAGIGIGKQNEQFQREVTVQHRQRIDNATLANLRMFKTKAGSGIGPDEPMFPGKIFQLDDIDDLVAIEGASEIYPSAYNNEQQAVIYAQQRSGVNELSLGMPQAGTPGTATGDMQRVQEYNRKFDYTYYRSRRFLKEIAIDVVAIQAQYGFRDPRYFQLLPDTGQRVQQFLSQSPEKLRSQLVMELSIVGENSNKALDRNNWTQISQIMTQYYTQMIQLCAQTGNKQMLQVFAQQAPMAATEAMKQILEGYDLRSIDKLIPERLISQMFTLMSGQQNGLQNSGLIGGGINPTQNISTGAGLPSGPPVAIQQDQSTNQPIS